MDVELDTSTMALCVLPVATFWYICVVIHCSGAFIRLPVFEFKELVDIVGP
jgi:hypothetical protein